MSIPQGQAAPPETPMLRLRSHGRALVLPVLAMLVLAAAAGYFVGALPEAWMNWAAGIGAVALFLLLGVGPVLSWLASRVLITDRRVIVRRGVLVHRRSEVPLARVREVRSKRGPMQRLFGSGDIELFVGPELPARLHDVPSPATVTAALQQLMEQAYLRVGVDPRAPLGEYGGAGHASTYAPGGYAETTVLPGGF